MFGMTKSHSTWTSKNIPRSRMPSDDFHEKMQYVTQPPTIRKLESEKQLKIYAFLKQYEIINKPEYTFLLAEEIYKAKSQEIEKKYKSLSTFQNGLRYETGERKKAIETFEWYQKQMNELSKHDQPFVKAYEIKQIVIKKAFYHISTWIQTICVEWSHCFNRCLKDLSYMSYKALMFLSQKHNYTIKYALINYKDIHDKYRNLMDEMFSKMQQAQIQKEEIEYFGKNLVYNMRKREKCNKELKKVCRFYTRKYESLKGRLSRYGIEVQDGTDNLVLPESLQLMKKTKKKRRNANRIKAEEIEEEVKILQEVVQIEKNYNLDSRDDTVEPNIEVLRSIKETTEEGHKILLRPPEKYVPTILLRAPYGKLDEPKEPTYLFEPTKYTYYNQRYKSGKMWKYSEESRNGQYSDGAFRQEHPKRTDVDNNIFNKMMQEYRDTKKFIGGSNFSLSVGSYDMEEYHDDVFDRVQSRTSLIGIPKDMEGKEFESKEIQTDYVCYNNEMNLQTNCYSNRRKRKTYVPKSNMCVATQTRFNYTTVSGIISLKLISTSASYYSVAESRRSSILRKNIKGTFLEPIAYNNHTPQKSTIFKQESLYRLSGLSKSRYSPNKIKLLQENMDTAEATNSPDIMSNSTVSERSEYYKYRYITSIKQQRQYPKKKNKPRYSNIQKSQGSNTSIVETFRKRKLSKRESSLPRKAFFSKHSSSIRYKIDLSEYRIVETIEYLQLPPTNNLVSMADKLEEVEVIPLPSQRLPTTPQKKLKVRPKFNNMEEVVNYCLKEYLSSGKYKLLSSEMLQKSLYALLFFSQCYSRPNSPSNSKARLVQIYYVSKHLRNIIQQAYTELTNGYEKIMLTTVIFSYFKILYGNVKTMSSQYKIIKFFRKLSEYKDNDPRFLVMCMLAGASCYDKYRNLVCVSDFPLYLHLLFGLNCGSLEQPYTQLDKVNAQMEKILSKYVGTEAASIISSDIRLMINNRLVNKNNKKGEEKTVNINLYMMCFLILERIFYDRLSFQKYFQTVFKAISQPGFYVEITLDFFEFLNRCDSRTKLQYITRIKSFLRYCELLHNDKKSMSQQKFTMYAMKSNFPRFSEIYKNMQTMIKKRTSIKSVKNFYSLNYEWKAYKEYISQELSFGSRMAATESALLEFITRMIEKSDDKNVYFLQTLYEMMSYQIFDIQAEKLLFYTIGNSLTDIYIESIIVMTDNEKQQKE